MFPDREDTQPTRSRWEPVSDKSKEILGGSRVGASAWGLAWVDTMIELPPEDQEHRLNEARAKIISDIEQAT